MRLAFESVDSGKPIAFLMWAGVIQFTEGLSRTKRQREGEFALWV